MSFEADFRAAAILNPAVQALIGSRLWLALKPANCPLPCATYQRISTVRQYTHNRGAGLEAAGARGWIRVQLTFWAAGDTSGEDVLAIRDAFLQFLAVWNQAAIPESPISGDQAPNFVLNERFTFEPQPNEPLARYLMDVQAWFHDPA